MNSEADDCVSLVAPSNANMEVKVSLQWGVEKGELPKEGYESDEGNKKKPLKRLMRSSSNRASIARFARLVLTGFPSLSRRL